MPGMYANGDYDLAGFAVGAVERNSLLPSKDLTEGDVVLGLSSSGVHSNGFSLVRRIVKQSGLKWNDPAPFNPTINLGEALLTPTRIYVKSLLPIIRNYKEIKALAHITGGGFPENIPRILPLPFVLKLIFLLLMCRQYFHGLPKKVKYKKQKCYEHSIVVLVWLLL